MPEIDPIERLLAEAGRVDEAAELIAERVAAAILEGTHPAVALASCRQALEERFAGEPDQLTLVREAMDAGERRVTEALS